MKKEKKVRTYQRRTKSGKTVTVRAHTASYEAAEKAKEAAKKKGAGDELSEKKSKKDDSWKLPMDEFLKKLKEDRAKKKLDEDIDQSDEKPKKTTKKSEKEPEKKSTKKRSIGTGTNGPEPKKKETKKTTAKKTAETSEPAFTAAEFKEWYRGTGSAADKKVAKALRKQLGRSGYRKFEDEAIDNYTSRGHLKMFKRVSGGGESSKTKDSNSTKVVSKASKPTLSKNMSENRSNASVQMKEYKKQLMTAIKDGNSKKIREARKGYLQAMDDSTFGGSKASKVSAEKDYQSVVKALLKAGYDEQGYKKRSVGSLNVKPPKAKKETSSDLRARADKMDADEKRAAIVKKLGSNRFRTIKDININVVKPNTRSAQLKGTLYVSSDGTKAYYEGSDGKLKKATKSILDRYVNKKSTTAKAKSLSTHD